MWVIEMQNESHLYICIFSFIWKKKIHQILKSSFSSCMLCWQYPDLGPYFIYEDDQRKHSPPGCSDVQPQYVHHVAPKPPPEISHSIPKHKGSPGYFAMNCTGIQCNSGIWYFSKMNRKLNKSMCMCISMFSVDAPDVKWPITELSQKL